MLQTSTSAIFLSPFDEVHYSMPPLQLPNFPAGSLKFHLIFKTNPISLHAVLFARLSLPAQTYV